MEQKINVPTEELRLGIGGLISGYLMLAGAEELTKIEQSKFRAKEVAFSETYAAMQVLSFIWTFGNHTIKKTDCAHQCGCCWIAPNWPTALWQTLPAGETGV